MSPIFPIFWSSRASSKVFQSGKLIFPEKSSKDELFKNSHSIALKKATEKVYRKCPL
jgi:hypothetical protein